MSLPIPNVPNLPGVPQLPGYAQSILSFGTQQITGLLWQSSQSPPAWGIYDEDGNSVVTPDSFYDFDNRNEWQVSTFPVQRGAFASYNKVQVPFECMVRMVKGGSQADRTAFEAQIAAIAGTTDLYTILTPERSYPDVNVTRYELTRRNVEGAYFFDIEVYFINIIQTTSQYQSTTTNAQDPTALPTVNTGTVQPLSLSAQDIAAVNAAADLQLEPIQP